MDDTAKDFKIVQIWPNQLVRTRKYEKALSERSEAINREIERAKADDIPFSLRRMEQFSRASRRRSSVLSQQPSFDTQRRKRNQDYSKRRSSNASSFKLPYIKGRRMLSTPTRIDEEEEPVHFILPPLILPPIHLGKPVDFKKLQTKKYVAQA